MLVCNNENCPFLVTNERKFLARCCMDYCPYCGEDMENTQ